MKKFKFSIIIAVYNVEKYVEEAIETVINQTMDFNDNIEIILVDDGSTDNSSVICKKYEKKYPDNIKYIYKQNGGPSSARNVGIKIAKGEYYNFLDSDDLLHKAALEKVYEFFCNHKEIDMVTLPIECIERQKGIYHRYVKFGNDSRVIDLLETPQDYVFSSAASFYKSSLFNDDEFNTDLKLAEDLFFNTKLYLKNSKFGLISPNDAVYYYRKRFSNNSLTNINEYTEDWIINTLEIIYKELLNETKKIYKTIPEFLQYIFIYNIVKRLDAPNSLSEKCIKEFNKICESILEYVDYNIIRSYNYGNYYMLAIILMFKNKNYDIKNMFYIDNKNNICTDGVILDNISNYNFKISSLEINNNKLMISGYFNDIICNDFKIICKNDKNIVNELKIKQAPDNILQKTLYYGIDKPYYCTGIIPLEETYYSIFLCVNNSTTPLKLLNIHKKSNSCRTKQVYSTVDKKFEIKVSNNIISINIIQD